MPARNRAFKLAAIAAVLAGAAVIAVLQGSSPASSPSNKTDVMLLYVGAEDCGPCRTWQRTEGASFRASSEFLQLTYREVESPTLLDVLKDEYWPDDLRAYRDRLGRGAGVPLWFVISNHEIVEQYFGASQWSAAVLPRIISLLR